MIPLNRFVALLNQQTVQLFYYYVNNCRISLLCLYKYQVTGRPAEGWRFDRWEGDHEGDVYIERFTISSDATVTAVFRDDIETGTVTDIDGNEYKTVVIGDVEWMAENLRVTHYRDGSEIFHAASRAQWRDDTYDGKTKTGKGAYSVQPHEDIEGLDSQEDVMRAYGKLYNGFAVEDSRGLCPDGWEVSSSWPALDRVAARYHDPWQRDEIDIDTMFNSNMLKSRRQIDSPYGEPWSTDEHPRWESHDLHFGIDNYGFNAVPGGMRSFGGRFRFVGESGLWWDNVRSGWDEHQMYYYRLSYNEGLSSGSSYGLYMRKGLSVRCPRDAH